VSEDERGEPHFSDLQNDLKSGRRDRPRCHVFDLIYLAGLDLTGAHPVGPQNAAGAAPAPLPARPFAIARGLPWRGPQAFRSEPLPYLDLEACRSLHEGKGVDFHGDDFRRILRRGRSRGPSGYRGDDHHGSNPKRYDLAHLALQRVLGITSRGRASLPWLLVVGRPQWVHEEPGIFRPVEVADSFILKTGLAPLQGRGNLLSAANGAGLGKVPGPTWPSGAGFSAPFQDVGGLVDPAELTVNGSGGSPDNPRPSGK
jgi:hypothetical protein